MKRAASFLYLFLALSLVASHTLAGQIQGYVYTRSFALSESGNKVWAEYDPATGQLVREIGEAVGALSPREWRALSGVEYRGYISQYEQVRGNYPPDLASQIETISRTDYESRTFYLADGQTEVSHKPDLRSTTAYVSIRPQSTRLLDDGSQIILAQYPVNPLEPLGNEVTSMLLKYTGSGIGEVKNQTANRIGFKTGFITDEAGNALDVPVDFGEGYSRKPGQSVLGPIANAQVEALAFGKGVTGEDGRYVAQWYSIPCPLYHYIIDGAAHVNLRYRRFNPKSGPRGGIYFLSRPVAEICEPDVFIVPFIGPWPITMGHATTHPHTVDFPVDVMVVSGTAELRNAPVGAMTQYGADEPDTALTGIDYDIDLDNDGQPDTVVLGHLLTDADGDYVRDEQGRVQFMPGEGGDPEHQRQGVYFSSRGEATGQPDVIRLMDRASFGITSHQGLLTEISEQDLRNTDIYLVRVSDGKLIAERIGLSESEADFGADAANSRFFYTLQMRNSFGDAYRTHYGQLQAIGRDFDKWQSESGINPELHSRQADHLQPGDQVRIIAINRATGYIGSTVTEMKPAGSAGSDDLAFQIDPIVMGPPNLQIWAERGYNIQAGLQAGEIRKDQIIGFEGASLTSDNYVKLYTKWLDQDGRPLPEALTGAGYTGRIAILSDDKTLPNDNQGVYQFAIDPGEHIQVLQLPNSIVTDAQHYYIQVSGEPKSGNPIFTGTHNVRVGTADFSSTGANPGILQKRPDKYVPFKVPVFDEQATELQRQTYRQIKRDNPNLGLDKPKPVYSWAYRPEFQFSSYQLEMQAIRGAFDEDGDGTLEPEEYVDILQDESPTISAGENLHILYNLNITSLAPLDYFNAGEGQELVFELGGKEVLASVGSDGSIVFHEFEQVAQLTPDDYLVLRLYANNDAGNVLWEYALQKLTVSVPHVSGLGPLEVSVDDSQNFAISAVLFGDNDEPFRTTWSAYGSATFTRPLSLSSTSAFYNTVHLPTVSDTLVTLMVAAGDSRSVNFQPIKMIAGVPNQLVIEQNGKTTVDGFGTLNIQVSVKDRYGNPVVDGTPVELNSNALIGQTALTTIDGEVMFALTGADKPGDHEVTVVSGSIVESFSVHIHEVDVSISVDQQIAVGTTATVTVSAVSTYGDLAGLPIEVSAVRGSLPYNKISLGSGNSVSIPMYVGDMRGDGSVYAYFGNTVSFQKFEVIEDKSFYLLDTVLVAGGGSGGAFDVAGETYQYTGQTTAVVHGAAGDTDELTLIDYLAPPMLSEVSFSMSRAPDPIDGHIRDEAVGVIANTSGISLVRSPYKDHQWAYEFSEVSAISFDYSHLQNVGNLGLVLRLRVDSQTTNWLVENGVAEALVFEHPLSGLSLSLTSAGHLVWRLKNDTGTTEVESAELTFGWHEVGAHLIGDAMVLQVDEARFTGSVEVSGSPLTTNNVVMIGRNFVGGLSSLELFDWNSANTVSFSNGSLTQQVTYDASGRARVLIETANANLFAARIEKRLRYESDRLGLSMVEVAFAQQGDGCSIRSPEEQEEFDFGEALGHAESFMRHMADCNYLPKIKKSIVTLQSDAGVLKKSLAVVELGAYTQLYIQMKTSELALALGPSCLKGIVVGQAESGAEATCEFISSLLLVGDLRDFALHSAWLFASEVLGDGDAKAKYDRTVYIFAAVGIVTTLAEVTGVGIVIDAAVAGCKTAAKIFSGNRYLYSLAKRAEDNILENWKDSVKLKAGFDLMLPGMQITAMVVLMGDEFDEAWAIISEVEPHQIDGLLKYAQHALRDAVNQVVLAPSYWQQSKIEHAYAALTRSQIANILDGDGAVRAALSMLMRAGYTLEESIAAVGGRSNYVKRLMNESIDVLGRNVDGIRESNEAFFDALASEEVLAGVAVIVDIGRRAAPSVDDSMDGGVRAAEHIMKFGCRPHPASCHAFMELLDELGDIPADTRNAAVFRRFMERIGDLAALRRAGKLTDEAYADLEKVLADLGRTPNFQRGAAFVISDVMATARKLANDTDEFIIRSFEKVEDIGEGAKHGTRKYDVTIDVDGVVYQVEMKSWDPSQFRTYMRRSLNGLKRVAAGADDVNDVVPGQMSKDLIDAMRQINLRYDDGQLLITDNLLAGMTKRWRFDSRMRSTYIDAGQMADEVVGLLVDDVDLVKELIVKSSRTNVGIDDISMLTVEEFLEGPLREVLTRMFVI